jgi:DNA-binding protein HU-beta
MIDTFPISIKTGALPLSSAFLNHHPQPDYEQRRIDRTSKRAAADAVEAVLEAIAGGIKKDKEVALVGFGTFKTKTRAARKGRNPKTGEPLKIKASKTVGFKCSAALKAKA